MTRVLLDARKMGHCQLHTYLIEMLPLPDHYGRNLDALYDCLTEMRDHLLIVHHTGDAKPTFNRARRVLEDAAEDNSYITVEFYEQEAPGQ